MKSIEKICTFQDIRHAFSLVDSNNNGSVYMKDIPTIFENLDEGFKDYIMEEDELNRYLEEIDLESSFFYYLLH